MEYRVYYNHIGASGNFITNCVIETNDKLKAIRKAYNSPLNVVYAYVNIYSHGVYQESLRPHQVENFVEEYEGDFLKDTAD